MACMTGVVDHTSWAWSMIGLARAARFSWHGLDLIFVSHWQPQSGPSTILLIVVVAEVHFGPCEFALECAWECQASVSGPA